MKESRDPLAKHQPQSMQQANRILKRASWKWRAYTFCIGLTTWCQTQLTLNAYVKQTTQGNLKVVRNWGCSQNTVRTLWFPCFFRKNKYNLNFNKRDVVAACTILCQVNVNVNVNVKGKFRCEEQSLQKITEFGSLRILCNRSFDRF
jgi:hypothetical protein